MLEQNCRLPETLRYPIGLSHKKAQETQEPQTERLLVSLVPFCVLLCAFWWLVTVREFADQGEQWQIHRDDDRTDRDAQEADQQRLDQRQQVGDGGVDFRFIEVS